MTHIFYAFAKPNAETGQCELADLWADLGANFEHRKAVGGNFGQLLKLKQKFPHLKIILSIGGGTYSKAFHQLVENDLLDTFTDSIMQTLRQYHYEYEHSKDGTARTHTFEYPNLFDGVDIDWEWSVGNMHDDDMHGYIKLLALLSKKLKAENNNMILTTALQVTPKVIANLPLLAAAQHVDWFQVMAYDFGGSMSSGVGMNAPICNQWSNLSIDNSICMIMNIGVSPEKLVLGIPLYGYVYDKTGPKLGSMFERTEKTGAASYSHIKQNYLDNPSCKIKWHEVSQVPYAYCTLPDDHCGQHGCGLFVSYDDPNSVARKIAYAKTKLLRGVFYWRLSGDRTHELILGA